MIQSLSAFLASPTAFWDRVERKESGCWEWSGSRAWGGYGRVYGVVDGKERSARAHRIAWELTNGPIPNDLLVCHHCDNPPCVNPAHLFLGTDRDNLIDAIRKGRHSAPDVATAVAAMAAHPELRARGERNGAAKLTSASVQGIRQAFASGLSKSEVGRRFGVSHVTVRHIVTGQTWSHLAAAT